MPITKSAEWAKLVENNKDEYGKACVDVAREVMRLLDERPGDFDTHSIISEADKNASGADAGITGFMACCVAQMVADCHSRGEEFRRKWNESYGASGEGVVNPAILTLEIEE